MPPVVHLAAFHTARIHGLERSLGALADGVSEKQ